MPGHRERRLPRIARRLCLVLLALAPFVGFGAPAMAAKEAPQAKLAPFIVGGTETKASQVPWQVFVLLKTGEKEGTAEVLGLCGGSILSSTEILTAAHCVDHENTNTPYAASHLEVLAGSSNIVPFVEEGKHSGTEQVVKVKSFRQHPYYNAETHTDDVAVLTLEKALTLSSADSTAAIGLAPVGATPAPGTALAVSGFGLQEGYAPAPNGKLYSTKMTAVSADACRETLGPDNSATVFCAASANSATCEGDSGSAIVTTSPLQQIGLVDYGPETCLPNEDDAFTNITAPEIRDFIEGNGAPPEAPRLTSPPALKTPAAPVSFAPMTCEPGGWSPAPSTLTYTFQVGSGPDGPVLQSGPSNVFVPPSTVVGSEVTCIVNAANEGGTATARSGTAPPLMADETPPTALISGSNCTGATCTLQVTAGDPNGVSFAVEATASYKAATCAAQPGKKKGKKAKAAPKKGKPKKALAREAKRKRKKAKKHHKGKPHKGKHHKAKRKGKKAKGSCATPVTVPLTVTPEATPGTYQVVAANLPYGTPITFSVTATNAAGLKQAAPATLSTTLAKPQGSTAKTKKHKAKKHKGKKGKAKKHKGKGKGKKKKEKGRKPKT